MTGSGTRGWGGVGVERGVRPLPEVLGSISRIPLAALNYSPSLLAAPGTRHEVYTNRYR